MGTKRSTRRPIHECQGRGDAETERVACPRLADTPWHFFKNDPMQTTTEAGLQDGRRPKGTAVACGLLQSSVDRSPTSLINATCGIARVSDRNRTLVRSTPARAYRRAGSMPRPYRARAYESLYRALHSALVQNTQPPIVAPALAYTAPSFVILGLWCLRVLVAATSESVQRENQPTRGFSFGGPVLNGRSAHD